MLSDEITSLIDETHLLHVDVINDLADVSLIGETINEINGYWEQKSTEIDQFLSERGQEFVQFLDEFGNKDFYAAPVVMGSGDGLSPENSATLNSILANLEPLILNTIYLQSGEHVLPSTITISGYRLKLLPITVNPNDPVIICTTHTTNQFISRDTGGAEPNQSQLCDAHGYNEYPLLLNDSQVILSNLDVRGTKHCVSAVNSSIKIEGVVKVELWVHSISCTQHSGCALTLENSSIYGEAAELRFQIFHPDYITCADNIIESANPLTIRKNSNFVVGTVSLINNIAADSLPKLDDKLDINCSYQTSFWIESDSRFSVNELTLFNVKQVFFGIGATIRASNISLQTGSEPVCWLSIVKNTLLTLGGDNWIEPLKLLNTSSVASIIGFNSELRLEKTNFIGMGGVSGTLIRLADNSRLLSKLTVLETELPQDSGFTKIIENSSSTAIFDEYNFNLATNNEIPVFFQRMTGKTLLSNGTVSGNGESLFLNEVGGCFVDNEQVFCGASGGGLEWFDENQELLVPSGYATLEDALLFLRDKRWASNISVSIKISGVVELTEPVYIDHPSPLIIEGDLPVEQSFAGAGSSGGSVGAWNVNFQISDASSVIVGKPVVLTSSGNELDGCWKVLSKTGNSISVEITSQNTTIPAISSAITTVFPSMLTVAEGNNCLIVGKNSTLTIKNLILFSSASSPWSGKQAVQSLGVLFIENVGFNGWYTAIESLNSELNSNNIYVGNTIAGLNITDSSSGKLDGLTICNGNIYGINVFGSSNITYTLIGFIQGNDIGIRAIRFSNIYDENLSCKSNATLDYVAELNSFIRAASIEAGSQTSPMPNVFGNNESLVSTN